MTKRRKLNKKQREIKRHEHANTFNDGFKMGYSIGYSEGVKAERAKREAKTT